MDLCLDGYLFKRNRINKNSINLLCKVAGCSSSVTVNREEKVVRFVDHDKGIQNKVIESLESMRTKFLSLLHLLN